VSLLYTGTGQHSAPFLQPGHRWAEAVALGPYTIVAARTRVTPTLMRQAVATGSAVEQELVAGTVVEVVESRFVQAEGRVRGRLRGGGWISIFNTANGFRWAQPLQVGLAGVQPLQSGYPGTKRGAY
jgi:hypothetical protein